MSRKTTFDYDLIPLNDERWVKKVEIWCKRCTHPTQELDSVLIIEGKERSGKTNGSVDTAGLAKQIMNRPIHMFFSVDDMIKFAQSTSGQIIIWDEPALNSLSGDQLNKLNKNLKRLLMMCGSKRHFFIFNVIDFAEFDDYITVERPHGFVHLFKGRMGHGCYIRYKKLEYMRMMWTKKQKRVYNQVKSHYLDFPKITDELFAQLDITINGKAHCTIADYKRMKDQAIASIGQTDEGIVGKLRQEVRLLKHLIVTEPRRVLTVEERAMHYRVGVRAFQRWKNNLITPVLGDRSVFEGGGGLNYLTQGLGDAGAQHVAGGPPNLFKDKKNDFYSEGEEI